MRRIALIALLAVLAPAVAAEASYHAASTGGIVSDLAITADGGYAVAGTGSGKIVCLRQDGTVPWNVSAGSPVTTVAVADAAGRIAAGTRAGRVLLLDGNGNRSRTANVSGDVNDLAFTGNARLLAVAAERITLCGLCRR